VIGAGPAGLVAALSAARAGADVILADEGPRMGGRLLAEADGSTGSRGPLGGGALAELAALPNVRLMPRTTVTGAYDGGTYGALERVGLHRAPRRTGPWSASGASWRRPRCWRRGPSRGRSPSRQRPAGVMLAGSVRAFLNRWGVVPGPRIAVFGNNDDAHRTARDLRAAGSGRGADRHARRRRVEGARSR
jgi:sarcosine oxidase subunit alpha